MTAAYLVQGLPHFDVTFIGSLAIDTIGVGLIRRLRHQALVHVLNLDEDEWMRVTDDTCKLGALF